MLLRKSSRDSSRRVNITTKDLASWVVCTVQFFFYSILHDRHSHDSLGGGAVYRIPVLRPLVPYSGASDFTAV